MDYASYKQFRDDLLARESPLRLDCMNPAQALAKWVVAREEEQTVRAASPSQAADAWCRATGIALDPERTVVGSGLRELLAAVIECGLGSDEELWLPEDVYPVYWELAQRGAVRGRAFATLPTPDWSFLAQAADRAALLVPIPLSPLGRAVNDAEERALLGWLHDSKQRVLIVDAVYTYDFADSREFALRLARDERCVVLWSCSKSWLKRNQLGVASAPPKLAAALRDRVSQPSPTTLGRITALLESQPNLPQRQQEAFRREWQRLDARVRAVVDNWEAPSSGYFSVVSASFEHLLKHGILSVPATVFGSQREDLSVITCLHDLVEHEGRPIAQ